MARKYTIQTTTTAYFHTLGLALAPPRRAVSGFLADRAIDDAVPAVRLDVLRRVTPASLCPAGPAWPACELTRRPLSPNTPLLSELEVDPRLVLLFALPPPPGPLAIRGDASSILRRCCRSKTARARLVRGRFLMWTLGLSFGLLGPAPGPGPSAGPVEEVVEDVVVVETVEEEEEIFLVRTWCGERGEGRVGACFRGVRGPARWAGPVEG